jgi:hypothetical protein
MIILVVSVFPAPLSPDTSKLWLRLSTVLQWAEEDGGDVWSQCKACMEGCVDLREYRALGVYMLQVE